MDDLIAKLEAADGPNFALEREIMWATRGTPEHQRSDYDKPPAYTASIDAALTLVPERWSFYRLNQYNNHANPAWGWGAHLRCHAEPQIGMAVGESRATPAIALCIAALRAHLENRK